MSGITEIVPGLFVGSVAETRRAFDANGTHFFSFLRRKTSIDRMRVVNAAVELGNITKRPTSQYLAVPLRDDGDDQDLSAFYDNIPAVLEFLDREALVDSNLLIHCQMGRSRSCSVAIVCLLYMGAVSSVEEGYQLLQIKRPGSFPHGRLYSRAIQIWYDEHKNGVKDTSEHDAE